jgi:hypothetical protein
MARALYSKCHSSGTDFTGREAGNIDVDDMILSETKCHSASPVTLPTEPSLIEWRLSKRLQLLLELPGKGTGRRTHTHTHIYIQNGISYTGNENPVSFCDQSFVCHATKLQFNAYI